MEDLNLQTFNKILGRDIKNDFNLSSLTLEEQKAVWDKVSERLQVVVVETALTKMDEKQFAEFKKATEGDVNKLQEKVSVLAKDIKGLGAEIKVNLEKEIVALEAIVNKK